jgi:hypothetical protein
MKILVTGSTASQVPSRRTESTPTFTRLLVKALTEGRHDVTWINPSVSLSKEYLGEFDSVIVGIAPPTSTAAHRIYGSLSVIHHALEIENLCLLLDAPEPKRVWAGIRAIYNNPENLTKEFYSKRQDYKTTSDADTLHRLQSSISFLYENRWPTTLFPAFPWMSFPSVSTDIPNTNHENLVGLNFDSFLMSETRKDLAPYRLPSDHWVIDAQNTRWAKSIEPTLSFPVFPVRQNKWENNESVESRIYNSLGSLISVYRLGHPWWSSILAQSLALATPVATDWQLSSMLGTEWSILPANIEDLSDMERVRLANSQKESYLNAVPSQKNSIEFTTAALLRK